MARVPSAPSLRSPPACAVEIGAPDPDQRLAVTIYVRRRRSVRPAPGSAADLARLMRPVTRAGLSAERARSHGRAAARITAFAEANGLVVRELDTMRRRIVVEGSVGRLAEIFGADLRMYADDRRRFRARAGLLHIPREIAPWTRAVLGFDERRQVLAPQSPAGSDAAGGLWPTEVAALYGLPGGLDLTGQCVGIIALGGGYKRSDVDQALAAMQQPGPEIVDQSVDGTTNSFGGGHPADQEIALDLQILAALLPGARVVVYFADNTTQSLANAVHQAVLDNVHRPQVLSISWGSAEMFWTEDARHAVQAALADAVRLRVSVVAAAGDELATGGIDDGRPHVFFPASSPYVLGCGGTAITAKDAAIETEVVWNETFSGTGGGISDVFPVPDYQTGIALPPAVNGGGGGRGVPDVAAAAGRRPGYRIIVNGQTMVKDGTSAAAPLWAAIIAMANAQRGAPIGLVHPLLYAQPNLLRPILKGDNRVRGIGYDAGPGWSACTGLGVPVGRLVVQGLADVPVA